MTNDPSPRSMSILGSAKVLVSQLITKFSERESHNISKILVEHVTDEPWARFFSYPERTFSQAQYRQWEQASARIVAGEPLQYVIGSAWFDEMQLEVGPEVLIPRPETEELVHWVAEERTDAKHILDIGTGSGCIALALARRLPLAQVTGIDVSTSALEMARRNAERHSPTTSFQQVDILKAANKDRQGLDVIVSNPPYIPEAERAEMEDHVLRHEPGGALFVPDDDPLIFYNRIIQLGTSWLQPGGHLYFEIHEQFGKEVTDLMKVHGYSNVVLKQDLSGRDRMAGGQWPGQSANSTP